jgi:hypothetical protein
MSEDLDIGLEKDVKNKPFWIPEDFGFEPHKIQGRVTREDVFYKDAYQLKRLRNDFWLLRKRIRNERGNTEYLIRFYLPITPHEIKFAKELFVNKI